MREQHEDKEEIIEFLRTTPVIAVACAKAGLARATLYRWLEADQKFAQQVKDALKTGNRNVDDLAYSKLIKKIKDESLGAITFYLGRRHPYFKKSTKMKVEVATKQVPIPEIPIGAFNQVLLSKIDKKLRKRVLRKGMKIHDALEEILNEVMKERPGWKKMRLGERAIDWGSFLQTVLNHEDQKKDGV